ncbi:MAG: prepilin-type N-terminal cleavage/methylation domain-containing protein [Pseudomonadota bacterium]|nr:prepilin-type N-terminal cleavage/methylation domain-containing protein [Pseudomonadota bacterium]
MHRDKQKGFTIIELIIAMAIMAFGILGFTFLNSRALNNRTFSRDLNRATVTAERVAENLLSLEYDDPLLADNNSEDPAVTSIYPTGSDSDGDTGSIAGMSYIVSTKAGAKWFTVQQEKQRYHLRWEVTTGNSAVANSPDDKVKLIRIFAAFEKKDPQTGNIILGGYNPAKIGPTIITFKTE